VRVTVGREAKKYLDYARECVKQAEEAHTQERRDKLIELARVWTQAALAEQAALSEQDIRGNNSR
jgi:hypothetical protein